VGEQLFPESIRLTSDPFSPETPGAPFDAEGLPLTPITWIDGGR
jgi:predicted Zn-dependent protease